MDPTTRQREEILKTFEIERLTEEEMATLLAGGELKTLVQSHKGAGLGSAVYQADIDGSLRLEEMIRRANVHVTDPAIYQISREAWHPGRRMARMRLFRLPGALDPEVAARICMRREVCLCRIPALLQLVCDFPLLAQEESYLALGDSATFHNILHIPVLSTLDGVRQLGTLKVPKGGTLPKNQTLLVEE